MHIPTRAMLLYLFGVIVVIVNVLISFVANESIGWIPVILLATPLVVFLAYLYRDIKIYWKHLPYVRLRRQIEEIVHDLIEEGYEAVRQGSSVLVFDPSLHGWSFFSKMQLTKIETDADFYSPTKPDAELLRRTLYRFQRWDAKVEWVPTLVLNRHYADGQTKREETDFTHGNLFLNEKERKLWVGSWLVIADLSQLEEIKYSLTNWEPVHEGELGL